MRDPDAPAPPEGYEETLAVVKALRAFADEAKRRRPARAGFIEQVIHAAQHAAWLVYDIGDER